MAVREKGATTPVWRWLPAALLALAAVGVVAVLPSISHDQGGRDWYRGRLGGSLLYTVDAGFARLFPFLIVGGIALALAQRSRRRKEQLADGATLRRHEWTEVATHWLNAIGLGLCLVTSVWLRRWFDNPLSLDTTYVIHFVGAGLMLAAVAHHLTYQLVGGGTGLVPRAWAEVKNAIAELIGYTGVYRGLRGVFGIQLPPPVRRPFQRVLRRLNLAPAPAGKYLATEKVLSYTVWAALIAVVVVTGIIKTLRYLFPVPAGLRQTATYLHDGSTIFLIIFLAIHVGALVLVPRNWPLLKSMFTTRIARAYADKHLPRWTEGAGGSEKH